MAKEKSPIKIKKSRISQLPSKPGVYIFYNQNQSLYIGKAANLKERIKSHFKQANFRDNFFIQKVKKVGYIKTRSEIEALVLEAELIKKHQPKFNVLWRDDKNYFFVVITKEDFPRVFITHQLRTVSPRGQSVGPFVDGQALKQTLKTLRRALPYRTCRFLPKKPCLWYQLDRCPAPCLRPSMEIKKICQRNAKNLIKILQGKTSQALNALKKEMKTLSKAQEFEKAGKIKGQIEALEKVLQHAAIFSTSILQSIEVEKSRKQILKKVQNLLELRRTPERIEAFDISNIQGVGASGAMVVFENGLPCKKDYRKFKIKTASQPNDIAMLKEVLLRRLKHDEWPWPDLILIDGGKAQLNAALQCLKPELKYVGLVALAKRKNELYRTNKKKPVSLKSLPQEISNLLLHIRDEAHRFAIGYHRKLRKKEFIK